MTRKKSEDLVNLKWLRQRLELLDFHSLPAKTTPQLGYLTPVEYEKLHEDTSKTAWNSLTLPHEKWRRLFLV
jgi:Zn-finger domain-containing protein